MVDIAPRWRDRLALLGGVTAMDLHHRKCGPSGRSASKVILDPNDRYPPERDPSNVRFRRGSPMSAFRRGANDGARPWLELHNVCLANKLGHSLGACFVPHQPKIMRAKRPAATTTNATMTTTAIERGATRRAGGTAGQNGFCRSGLIGISVS